MRYPCAENVYDWPSVPEGCGFSLQNRGIGFVTATAHPNCVAGGKCPYHTIIPGLLTKSDGSLYGAFGVMSSYMQPQGHMQVVSNMVDWGDDAQVALDQGRFRVTGAFSACEGQGEDAVLVEESVPPEVRTLLQRRGHVVQLCTSMPVFGRGQIILRDDASGSVSAGSDPRADGIAIVLPRM